VIDLKRPVRLLYVDDDRALSRLVQKELGRHGYDVVCAGDGDEGLRLMAEGGWDVCALDHYMPGRDGIDVLPEMIALPDAPPVVYVTGAQEGSLAVAALRAGAADYVIKDVSEDFTSLLRSAIDDALTRRRL
jgi:DNA-binding response OmpR family regulator